MKPITMKVALYARVSTTDQDCAMQLSELRRYVEARGWTIFHEYVDHGWSGKNDRRPNFQKCMADARARRFDCIIVWKLDRWGRSLRDVLNSIEELDGLGVRWMAMTQGLDTDKANSMSRMFLQLLAVFSEYERAVIQERVVAGVRKAQQTGTRSGKAIGRPKRIFNRDQIREMRAAGQSYGEIQKATGVPVTTIRRTCEQ